MLPNRLSKFGEGSERPKLTLKLTKVPSKAFSRHTTMDAPNIDEILEDIQNSPKNSKRHPKDTIREITMQKDINDTEAYHLFELVKQNKFFLQYLRGDEDRESLDPCYELCKNLRHVRFKEGDIILKQNEESDGRVYLVISGKLNVVVKSMNFLEGTAAENFDTKRE
jgi:hypothetical protein